jgi:thioredoxin-dependent peroxiredoxin
MINSFVRRAVVTMALASLLPLSLYAANPPKAGDPAPDFSLKTLDNQTVHLADLTATGNVVVVILRGWPGYQCPFCTRQVHDYIQTAPGFGEAKARVVMVYPGPVDDLKAHAAEFVGNKEWPKDFLFVIDPDFDMVNAYGLRWNAPNETAYPSTFVLDQKRIVRFAKISHGHDDRSNPAAVIKELKSLP